MDGAGLVAPSGREGVFLMLSSWPVYLTKYPAGLFSGWLLSTFVPDCPECKDDAGHFCDPNFAHGKCMSASGSTCPLTLETGCAQVI
jgi:hypothetical protein